jgi:MFS family permease
VVTLLREPARPAAIREHRLAPWFAVGTVCFGAFMGQLDASVVTVAFPALQRQFGTGLAAVQWVSLAYLLALTTLLVPAGRWSDRVGRKLLYLGTARALGGALCSYLVLFGPLVLFPQVVSAQGGSALAAGLLLTSLPAGFGVAAVLGDRFLPAHWPNSRRCAVGGALASGCAAALAVPAPHPVSVVLLGLLGAGLGVYTPANNAEIMTALPAGDAAAAGGMVNMTRGIGTALGVAVVTLGLHAGAILGHSGVRTGQELAMAALAAVALAATWAGMTASGSRSRPGSQASAELL